ncbi:Cytochrome c oxidase subunit 4 [Serendipita sp. 401]|nr:Cytochrome c oxidase subunit 4 [Serendipita sp. 398]KAG8811399.1 Cytochrome c oxidase subunit 4 [Serendipita sp. 401]
MLGLRTARALLSAAPKARKPIISQQVIRTISSSSQVRSSAPTPAIFGEGAKAGEVPSDLQQATGLERLQLLGQMEGIDVFNTGPLLMTKKGTVEDPTIVHAYSEERIVGCTGWPVESHDIIWISTNNHKEHHRCPECGNGKLSFSSSFSSTERLISPPLVFKMEFLGEAGGHGHH